MGLFGGGSETKVIDPYAGTGIRQLYKQLNDILGGQIGQGMTPYSGTTVAGTSPLQQSAFGAAGGITPMATGAQNYFTNLLGGLGGQDVGKYMGMAESGIGEMMKPYDTGAATQYWQQSFVNPAMQTWLQQIMPAIKEQYVDWTGTGKSGGVNTALARSGENLSTNLGGQLANILYQGQQAQLGRQQTGVNQLMSLAGLPTNILQGAGQIGGMGTDMLSSLFNLGTQQRGMETESLQEQYNKWMQSQPYNNPWLQYLGTALGQPGMQVVSEQQGPGLASLLPGLGSFLGTSGSADNLFGNIGGLASGAMDLLGGAGGLLGGLGGLGALLGFI